LYGIYTALHFQSMFTMLKGIKGRSRSAKIFLSCATIMYLIATAHVSMALHFLLRRRATQESESTWFSATRWEYRAYTGSMLITLWIFDCLMIYRCYVIWSKRFSIIVPSIVLFFASIIIAFLVWLSTTGSSNEMMKTFKRMAPVVLPVNILQNILSTVLICFRLIHQFRTSHSPGFQPTQPRLNLFHVVRIILESAAIFTTLFLITIVLYSTHSRIVWILVGMMTPTIGITFSLISIRIYAVTSQPREPRTSLFTVSPCFISSTTEATRTLQSENQFIPVRKKELPDQ